MSGQERSTDSTRGDKKTKFRRNYRSQEAGPPRWGGGTKHGQAQGPAPTVAADKQAANTTAGAVPVSVRIVNGAWPETTYRDRNGP